MLLAFFKLLRPKQWTKNFLLFAGILFAWRVTDIPLLINVVAGFFIFCALSGFVYIVNDIVDVEKDREHPKKKNRPIASGAISPSAAGIGGTLLLLGSLVGAWFITDSFFVCSVIYVILVTAYSFKLKHVVIMDIMVLAMGFVVRAIAGIEAMHVEGLAEPVKTTPYFILTTLFLALFLAITKRRSEMNLLQGSAGGHRKVLEDYTTEYVDVLLTVATTGVIASYGAWATSGDFARLGDGSYTMVFTMPFVLYGVFRYLWLAYRKNEGGAPEELLLTDKPLLATVLLWLATVVAILLFSK